MVNEEKYIPKKNNHKNNNKQHGYKKGSKTLNIQVHRSFSAGNIFQSIRMTSLLRFMIFAFHKQEIV